MRSGHNSAGSQYGALKKAVTEAVVAKLEPIQKKFAELTSDRTVIRELLRKGAERVAPIAESTMKQVRERVGLYGG